MSDNSHNLAEGITWPSAQSLIQLRLCANQIPLDSGKIHAKQGGAYVSSFKGRGMEFDESRIYQAGDDIRNMDWLVTARTGTAHTKVFREERERPIILWLDLGISMMFATRNKFKSVIASEIAALIAWSAAKNNDRIGGLIFSAEQHVEIKPRRGKTAALDFIGRCAKHEAWTKQKAKAQSRYEPSSQGETRSETSPIKKLLTGLTRFKLFNHKPSYLEQAAIKNSNKQTKSAPKQLFEQSAAITRLRSVTHPGSLVFMISDFHAMNEESFAQIANISRNSDIIMIKITDPFEAELPASGSYKLTDGISELQIQTSEKKIRNNYRQRYLTHQQQLERFCRQHRIHLINISTDDDTIKKLTAGLGVSGQSKNSAFRAARVSSRAS